LSYSRLYEFYREDEYEFIYEENESSNFTSLLESRLLDELRTPASALKLEGTILSTLGDSSTKAG